MTAVWPRAVASETEGRLALDDLRGTEDRSWCVMMWEVKEAREVSGRTNRRLVLSPEAEGSQGNML